MPIIVHDIGTKLMTDANIIKSQHILKLMEYAGENIILPHYQSLNADEISEKSPGELVTIADKMVEEYLSKQLLHLYPGHKIYGEESAHIKNLTPEMMEFGNWWIIDPIDGTYNFTKGHPPFAIMLAQIIEGQAVFSAIYDPIQQRYCTAFIGEGAYINGQKFLSNYKRKDAKIKAAISTMFMTDEQAIWSKKYLSDACHFIPIPRCAGEQYPLVAKGEHEIAFFERVLPWDHVAGALFVNVAGGYVAHLDGSAYKPYIQKNGLLAASSQQLWDEAALLFKGFPLK